MIMSIDYSADRLASECIETALTAYVECALWSSVGADDDGAEPEPLDATHDADDVAPTTLEAMRADVTNFLAACWGDTWDDFNIPLESIEAKQLGHDLWLTRNHHGTGFWDRGLGDVGEALTTLARTFGEVELYVGDDGLIYAT